MYNAVVYSTIKMFFFFLLCFYLRIEAKFPCNIPKVSINPQVIIEFPPIPTIFVDSSLRNAALSQFGSKDQLIQNFGRERVQLTSSNTFSQGDFLMSLQDYIETMNDEMLQLANESKYLFGNNFGGVWDQMSKIYATPPCKYCKKAGAVVIGIGGHRSGVSFHLHGPGFSEAIIGQKHWLLFSPNHQIPGFHPNQTVYEWMRTVYQGQGQDQGPPSETCQDRESCDPFESPSLNHSSSFSSTSSLWDQGLWECTLSPGEMLYFPHGWMHATLNLGSYCLFASTFLDPQLMSGEP